FDRAVKLAQEFSHAELAARWSTIAAQIHADVCARGFDETLGSFVQSYGSKWPDGSLLPIPTPGFLPVDDPRCLGTIRAVEKRLLADGFVMSHDTPELEEGTG